MGVTTGAVGEQHTFTETYTYDNLHRLKTNQVNGIKIGSYTYDAIGNLLSKSDYSDQGVRVVEIVIKGSELLKLLSCATFLVQLAISGRKGHGASAEIDDQGVRVVEIAELR
ncbi:hypothetical protein MHM89_03650 [Pseudoalteromonas sp. CNC9-20]|uniref:hypothetical protein n=1 Tax=Pseudoalteromonas sp. CNC9-20 TaxID=2917750 RepID=UPI001EF540CD|nr:hypothetical protein [Pseudoalteromonas sp. CNC9-20]MCG7569012.1 hypothetical protein [Pseudoalteromonas sp. CNC9-20]